MTIRQQGGIFGRNPTFNNVTADQINSNGAVIAAGAGSFGDDVNINGDIILANGKGIDFSATSGTGTSELFDDYEEGTWTPVDASGTLGAALAFAVGNYSKIGRMVFASFMITYPASANTNTASLGGLPFLSMTGNQTGGSAITYTDFGSFISVLNSAGGSTALLCNASGAFLTNANMSGKIIRGTVSYMTA
jgi:hypothetical protein